MGCDNFISRMEPKARGWDDANPFYDPSGFGFSECGVTTWFGNFGALCLKHNLITQFSTTPSRQFGVNNINSGYRTVASRSTNYMVRDGYIQYWFVKKQGIFIEAGNCVLFETNVGYRQPS